MFYILLLLLCIVFWGSSSKNIIVHLNSSYLNVNSILLIYYLFFIQIPFGVDILSFSHFLVVLNTTAVNIHLFVFVWKYVFILSEWIPRSVAVSMVILCLTRATDKLFSQVPAPFHVLTPVYEGFPFSISWSALVTVCLFFFYYICHSGCFLFPFFAFK